MAEQKQAVGLILKIRVADVNLQSYFLEPAVGLFRDALPFIQQLRTRLAKHGVQLTDLRWDQGNGSLGDYSLLCTMFNLGAFMRTRMERVEFLCPDLARVGYERLNAVVVDGLTAVKGSAPTISFRSHALTLGFHGVLEGRRTTEYLARFVGGNLRDLGPSTGNAVVFYYGQKGTQLASSVTLDVSTLVEGGLYLRTYVNWDAAKVPAESLLEASETHLREVWQHLGLKVEQKK